MDNDNDEWHNVVLVANIYCFSILLIITSKDTKNISWLLISVGRDKKTVDIKTNFISVVKNVLPTKFKTNNKIPQYI